MGKELNIIIISLEDVEHVLSMIYITRDFIRTAKEIQTNEQRDAFVERAYRYISLQDAAIDKLNGVAEDLGSAKDGIEDFMQSAKGLFSSGKAVLA